MCYSVILAPSSVFLKVVCVCLCEHLYDFITIHEELVSVSCPSNQGFNCNATTGFPIFKWLYLKFIFDFLMLYVLCIRITSEYCLVLLPNYQIMNHFFKSIFMRCFLLLGNISHAPAIASVLEDFRMDSIHPQSCLPLLVVSIPWKNHRKGWDSLICISVGN